MMKLSSSLVGKPLENMSLKKIMQNTLRALLCMLQVFPFSLKTLGSFLYNRSPLAWRATLRKLEQLPNASVFEILKISYDGHDEMEKKVFLDIACFHRLYYDELMIEQVYSSDFCTRIVIDVLVEKCLLSIVLENNIEIHEMVEEMGCEIVRRECCEEPGGRSRLWLRKDIFHVFKNNTVRF